MSSEKFCLKWNDFQENISTYFHSLREDTIFTNVTLACEDGNQIEAHKVILTACSPFFHSLLTKNKHSNPLIYMRGLKAKDLIAVVDFIYHGEVNIFQEDLDNFLALADELKLKGLSGTNDNTPEEAANTTEIVESFDKHVTHSQQKKMLKRENVIAKCEQETNKSIVPVDYVDNNDLVSDAETAVLKDKIISMMERTTGGWKCLVCETKPKDKTNMARHVESHIEGFSHNCNLCGKTTRSSKGLVDHISVYHRK